MSLTGQQKRRLRGQAHSLDPVVWTGAAGVTHALIHEVDRALDTHELIKVRLAGAGDRHERRTSAENICAACDAELVQIIGHVAVIYREAVEGPITGG